MNERLQQKRDQWLTPVDVPVMPLSGGMGPILPLDGPEAKIEKKPKAPKHKSGTKKAK